MQKLCVFTCVCTVWFAHSQVNGIAQAFTWMIVTQPEESCVIRLLSIQEENSLNSASGAFQPIQLQLCSQVWGDEGWWRRMQEKMSVVHMLQSLWVSVCVYVCLSFIIVRSYLWAFYSTEHYHGSWENVLYTSTVCICLSYSCSNPTSKTNFFQQKSLMRCLKELAPATDPPNILFSFSLSLSPLCLQLLTHRAGDPHTAHCCTDIHLETGEREYAEDMELDKITVSVF